MTGDNVVCTICHTPFDCRNSAYEIINGAWICGDCIAGHTGEELTEKLEIETMGTIKQFDTTILSTLRADIQRALNSVASEHGITLDLGNIGFQTNTFTAKVIGTVDGFDQSHADYLQYCDQFSLDKSWLCETFRGRIKTVQPQISGCSRAQRQALHNVARGGSALHVGQRITLSRHWRATKAPVS